MTLALLSSMGGGGIIASPILLPLLLYAAVRSGRPGRVVFSILAGVVAGEVVWAVTYVLIGETVGLIWLLPITAVLLVAAAYFRISGLGLEASTR